MWAEYLVLMDPANITLPRQSGWPRKARPEVFIQKTDSGK